MNIHMQNCFRRLRLCGMFLPTSTCHFTTTTVNATASTSFSTAVIPELKELEPTLIEWRHDFHRHPELAFEERRTSKIVKERLSSWGIDVTTGVGCETSVVGTLKGTKNSEHTTNTAVQSIGLRADMDALPMTEESDIAHKSTVDGLMHGCGHDGHTTMLLGAAKYLSENRNNFQGTVHFIFQPAEEDGGGGEVMVKGGLFDKFPCDEIYGMHNWPLNLEPGKISVRTGPIMACADDFEITLIGRGGHAAMPHLTTDPIVIGSALIMQLQTLVSRNVDPLSSAVVSITGFQAGEGSSNIIPDTVKLVGTVRAFQEDTRIMLKEKLNKMCSAISSTYGGDYIMKYNDGYPATSNTTEQTEYAANVAIDMVGEENVVRDLTQTMGAEDFSYMLNYVKAGCYIWLGSSSKYFLHHPKYDFDDSTLSLGSSWFVNMVESRLG